MNKVFKEDFSLFESGINIGRIDWENSVGKIIRFKYEGLEGEIKIEEYIYPNIKISYNGRSETMHISQLRKCQLGNFLNVYSKNYMYDIGDIISNNIILEQIRVKQGNGTSKGYKYKCLKDGYVGETTEVAMKKLNCPVCSNLIVMKGVNDIATSDPKLIHYFVNTNDVYTHTRSSGKKTLIICPDCGNIKKMEINNFTKNGVQCNRCSDGRSYPEKFVFELLKQLYLDFIPEKIFEWSNSRYDFYIKGLNIIVEVMGNQHFEKGFDFYSKKGRTSKEEQENDIVKQKNALNNGISNYIIIDARKSDLNYLKKSILDSELSKIFDLSNINWEQCEKFALSTRIKEACKLWNSGLKTLEISEIMKVGRSTICSYLNKGKNLSWCDYDNK